MANYRILGISGSIRKGSFNTSLIEAFAKSAPEGVVFDTADIADLPLFSQDIEASVPESVANLREKIQQADGIIIATPEYNRSIPGVLKNAVDWGSRPYGAGSWNGKPVLVVGASVAPTGAAVGQYELKKTLLYTNALVMGQPEFFLGSAQDKFDGEGTLTDESTKSHVASAWTALTGFIDRLK